MTSPRQLVVLRFDPPTAAFEGRLLTVLERAEAGGALAVLEALYAAHDRDGAVEAVSITGGAGALVTTLTDFRLDPGRRRRMSEEDASPALRDLAAGLAPGEALVAVLVEHRWHGDLVDAAARGGGVVVADAPVTAAGGELARMTAQALASGSLGLPPGEASAPR